MSVSRARLSPPNPPDPTPEYDALTPLAGESPLDALARVGDTLVGPTEQKDPSRPPSKLPTQLAALVALRAQGYDNHEICERLNVTKQTLKTLIAKARKVYGWSDLGDKLAHVAVPQAVENLIKHLDHEGTATAIRNGQHGMTRRTLDGVGLFRTHSAVKQETTSEETHILRVEIVLPTVPSGQMPAVSAGSVLATPRTGLPDLPILPESDHADVP